MMIADDTRRRALACNIASDVRRGLRLVAQWLARDIANDAQQIGLT